MMSFPVILPNHARTGRLKPGTADLLSVYCATAANVAYQGRVGKKLCAATKPGQKGVHIIYQCLKLGFTSADINSYVIDLLTHPRNVWPTECDCHRNTMIGDNKNGTK